MSKLVRGMWGFIALAWLSPVIMMVLLGAFVGLARVVPVSVTDLLLDQGVGVWPFVILLPVGALGIVVAPVWTGIRFWKGFDFADDNWPLRQMGLAGAPILSTLCWHWFASASFFVVLAYIESSTWSYNPAYSALFVGAVIVWSLLGVPLWPRLLLPPYSSPYHSATGFAMQKISPSSAFGTGDTGSLVFLSFVLLTYAFAILGALVHVVRTRCQRRAVGLDAE